MCEYSLEGFANRKAQIGDRLVITRYVHGFVTEDSAKRIELKEREGTLSSEDFCLICLENGTRLDLVERGTEYRDVQFVNRRRQDTIHLPDGTICPVAGLPRGTTAKVLSIPGVNITERGVENVKAALVEHDKTQPTSNLRVTPAPATGK